MFDMITSCFELEDEADLDENFLIFLFGLTLMNSVSNEVVSFKHFNLVIIVKF